MRNKKIESFEYTPIERVFTQPERIVAKFESAERLQEVFDELGMPHKVRLGEWIKYGSIPYNLIADICFAARYEGVYLSKDDWHPVPERIRNDTLRYYAVQLTAHKKELIDVMIECYPKDIERELEQLILNDEAPVEVLRWIEERKKLFE